MEHLLNRVESEDLDLVITAVNIQREVGGNLAEILDMISHTIRVNGAYRHGFLLAPALAEAVAAFIATGVRGEVFRVTESISVIPAKAGTHDNETRGN